MRTMVCLSALACALGLAAAPAHAATVDDAVAALADADVWVEAGAPLATDRAELERAAAGQQEGSTFFKVVVVRDEPPDGSARSFAGDVLAGLGGGGRVVVYAPGEVGVASDVDRLSNVALAESAAVREGASAAGVEAVAEALADAEDTGATGPILPGLPEEDEERPAGAPAGQSRPGFGGVGLMLLVVLLVGGFLVVPMLLRSRRRDVEAERRATAVLGQGERRVREAVERAGNLIIELSDRIDVPDVPRGASTAYRAGSAGFIEVSEQLEHADTRAELEDVYPRVAEVVWHLETARAALDGEPLPARPEPEPLFPREELAPYEPLSYSNLGASPWLTDSAAAALALLGTHGTVWTSHRPPMAADAFAELFGLAGFPMPQRGRRRRKATWRFP